jgi:hypothetical protein
MVSLVALLLSTLTFTGYSSTVPAPSKEQDWWGTIYLRQSMDSLIEVATEALQGSAYGIDDGTSIFAALLEEGKTISFTRTLEKGKSYLLVAVGDEDATDIDLLLKDVDGRIVAEDVGVEDHAMIAYVPKTTGPFTFTLTLYEATSLSFVSAVILSDDGWEVPLANLNQAVSNIIIPCNILHRANFVFHDDDNQWTLYGGILKPDESQTIDNIMLRAKDYAFAAACDDASDDIDLFLLRLGRQIRSDEELDSLPMIFFKPQARSDSLSVVPHSLKLTNAGSSATLGLMVIMRSKD